MNKTILITGGTGFLGVHLSRLFLKKNYKVTLFDQAPLDAKDLIGKVTVIKGDIRKKVDIEQAMKGNTYVVHAAAALPIQRTKKLIYGVNIELKLCFFINFSVGCFRKSYLLEIK